MTAASLVHEFLATLGGIFGLQPASYAAIASMSHVAVYFGLIIVLLAGFSEAVAQSIVLFANRVKPVRFFFSWTIDAFLFVFGYVFVVISTWLVCRLPGTPHVHLLRLAIVIAASYAPLLFSFLGAMPYLGPGILTILRVWHFLSMVVGVAVLAGTSLVDGAFYVVLGWVVMVLAQQSFGKPIAALGTRAIDAVAGVKLVSDENAILGRVEQGIQHVADAAPQSTLESPKPSTAHPHTWKVVLGFLGVGALVFIVAVVLDPVRGVMFSWEDSLPHVVQFPLNLVWLTVIAVVVAALMAPLETLGWWAGWYGDRIDVAADPDAADAAEAKGDVTRYVIYLDGIAQSSAEYTPDIETFLDALSPELPRGVRLIRGVMGYSVLNKPLEDDPVLSNFWKFVEWMRLRNVNSLLGMFINLRNVTIVAVSADKRYGPMYNFGIAQILYRSLVANGYVPKSGIPVTLIGYSGGGQMSCGAAYFLKAAIDAPIDVISLGGVISGNDRILELEHLYHLVGTKDHIERIGPTMFPSRWKIAVLSYWNRARRLGRLTQISLGPVGHQVPGGMLDPNAHVPDGRTNLRQTLDYILSILADRLEMTDVTMQKKTSNYDRYVEAPFNRPEYYPLAVVPANPHAYKPVAPWVGRLILPERDKRFGGAWLEVMQAPDAYTDLLGSRVKLMWNEDAPGVRELLRAVRRDVSFSAEAYYTSTYGGFVHPVRLNRWRLVDPLESLAGAHPIDDVMVKLAGSVTVERGAGPVVRIERQPVQITGRWYALVRFLKALDGDEYEVVHYNTATGAFDGYREVVYMPAPVDDAGGRPPAIGAGIERSPLNHDGWYAYGAPETSGRFVVRSLAPRALLRVDPLPLHDGDGAPYHFLRYRAWRDIAARRGNALSVAFDKHAPKVGDKWLIVHGFGGIGGPKADPDASGPIYFGHFAYGIAEVVLDVISGEARWDITYYQVYTHNTDGLIAGALDYSRYLGDRQFGWAGLRPVCDVLLYHAGFAQGPQQALVRQLEAMTARYRIGDGTGGTYVGAANNCSQDSNRALFAALHDYRRTPLAQRLRRELAPFGAPRRDWSHNEYNLGSTMEDAPLQNLMTALASWRCIFPRLACDSIAGTFMGDEARSWILGSDAVGGDRSDIAPVIPFAF